MCFCICDKYNSLEKQTKQPQQTEKNLVKFRLILLHKELYLTSFKQVKWVFFFQVERGEICFGIKDGGSLNFSKINCAQLLPYVCWENHGEYDTETHNIMQYIHVSLKERNKIICINEQIFLSLILITIQLSYIHIDTLIRLIDE